MLKVERNSALKMKFQPLLLKKDNKDIKTGNIIQKTITNVTVNNSSSTVLQYLVRLPLVLGYYAIPAEVPNKIIGIGSQRVRSPGVQ